MLAKATSAIRSADNGSELVDRIETEADVEVEVISGLEEARLIFAAVRASVVIDPAPAAGIDIGGGSVELMIGDSRLRWPRASRSVSVASPPSSCAKILPRRANASDSKSTCGRRSNHSSQMS